MSEYDSREDTLRHIGRVHAVIRLFCDLMGQRATDHDASKLVSPEKEAFDAATPKLRSLTYGSDEYKLALKDLGVALQHHYENNSHHPEHFPNGIDGMSLMDVIEMFCDWKAATERHADGCLEKSIRHNKERFAVSDQLTAIFENTRTELGW